jgi:hypothetical protein
MDMALEVPGMAGAAMEGRKAGYLFLVITAIKL